MLPCQKTLLLHASPDSLQSTSPPQESIICRVQRRLRNQVYNWLMRGHIDEHTCTHLYSTHPQLQIPYQFQRSYEGPRYLLKNGLWVLCHVLLQFCAVISELVQPSPDFPASYWWRWQYHDGQRGTIAIYQGMCKDASRKAIEPLSWQQDQ